MRIAFFGGTFDPPHRGHLAIARAAADRLSLDRVLLAPVAAQPLKGTPGQAGFADRLAMVKLAVDGDRRLVASTADAPRPDGRPNYTIDTLAEVKRSLAAGDTLFCLLGADAFLSLRRWRRPRELLLFCEFIVAGRPGSPLSQIAAALPPGIEICGEQRCACWTHLDLAGDSGGQSGIFLLPDLDEDISATEIRAAMATGWETQTILQPAVAKYILDHGLYRDWRQPG